jgi:hypothetical protein
MPGDSNIVNVNNNKGVNQNTFDAIVSVQASVVVGLQKN